MRITRRKARVVRIGKVSIGGDNPIAIQSMAKTKTADVENTVRQIKQLEKAGCEIVRLAVKDNADAKALRKIKDKAKLPLAADIHFNWRLAIEAIESGVDKIRLNPGNIYKKEEVRKIASAAKRAGIPIRVGLNSGSLPQAASQASGVTSMPEDMVKSALDYIKILEKCGFYDIVVSLKASNIFDTIDAYRRIAKLCDYPLHLGLTAGGLPSKGIIKSGIAIGALLLEGIGDTIRVSLTAEPQQEVEAAKAILEVLRLRSFGPEVISCPTCGRCEVDLRKLVKEFENKFNTDNWKLATGNSQPFRVALMGCVVNGPGEAKEADIGVAFGRKDGLLFKSGRPIKKVSFSGCVDTLLKEMREIG